MTFVLIHFANVQILLGNKIIIIVCYNDCIIHTSVHVNDYCANVWGENIILSCPIAGNNTDVHNGPSNQHAVGNSLPTRMNKSEMTLTTIFMYVLYPTTICTIPSIRRDRFLLVGGCLHSDSVGTPTLGFSCIQFERLITKSMEYRTIRAVDQTLMLFERRT